jgi:hypothetical protein
VLRSLVNVHASYAAMGHACRRSQPLTPTPVHDKDVKSDQIQANCILLEVCLQHGAYRWLIRLLSGMTQRRRDLRHWTHARRDARALLHYFERLTTNHFSVFEGQLSYLADASASRRVSLSAAAIHGGYRRRLRSVVGRAWADIRRTTPRTTPDDISQFDAI